MKYQPPYPILRREDLNTHIQVNPEQVLDPLSLAELRNLRRGITYHLVHGDTRESREALFLKTTYFQMVAFAEGWTFNPDHYRVTFLPPNNPVFSDQGMKRIYEFDSSNRKDVEEDLAKIGSFKPLSYENRAGFLFTDAGNNQGQIQRLKHNEADGLANKVKRLFGILGRR